MNEHERTMRVAELIQREHAANGQTFREGQYVAVLDGNIVAVADDPDEAITALRRLNPDPTQGMIVKVAHPVVDVIL